jgi:RluA family pseudouridine synthase
MAGPRDSSRAPEFPDGNEPVSPRSAERRSPRALAHDPPVLKHEWAVDRPLEAAAFLDAARARLAMDDAAWERLLRHDGLHVDRVRWGDRAAGAVPAGTQVVAYAFVREPEPLVLPESCVLFDEDGLVAVDKPPWWAVQGTRASRCVSLETALRRRLDCPMLTPVHRLDRETTGVLLFARDGRAAAPVARQFARREVRKEYAVVGWCEGEVPERFEVEGRMVRVAHPSHSLFELRDGEEGLPSRTSFETVARSGSRVLLRALPLTGRTHQLRVHLAARGLPIVGDSLYGRGFSDGEPWSAERMLLHAQALCFRLGDRDVEIRAPLPPDFPAFAAATAATTPVP